MLDKLKKMTGGDEKQMQLYIQTYIEGMTVKLSALKAALANEEYHDIGTIVHTSKSLFNFMGFDALYKLASHIEMGINKRYSQEMTKEHTTSLIEDIQESIDELKGN